MKWINFWITKIGEVPLIITKIGLKTKVIGEDKLVIAHSVGSLLADTLLVS